MKTIELTFKGEAAPFYRGEVSIEKHDAVLFCIENGRGVTLPVHDGATLTLGTAVAANVIMVTVDDESAPAQLDFDIHGDTPF